MDHARAHASLKARAKIHAQAVGGLVIQRGDEAFAGGHPAIIRNNCNWRQLPILKDGFNKIRRRRSSLTRRSVPFAKSQLLRSAQQ
jgi:hypothetical protein